MLSRSEEKRIRALGRRKGRAREGLFLAEGIRVVEELLDGGLRIRLILVSPALVETDRGARLRERVTGADGLREVPDARLRQLADTATVQGVLAVAEVPGPALEAMEPTTAPVVLVLDGVQDPGNLGTLARTAAAFGAGGLVCLPGTVDPWNPKAVRASAGALFRRPVIEASLDELTDWIERHGGAILGADASGVPVREAVPAVGREGPTALVVGNEGAGLTPEVAARCGRLVSIPMPGGTESLNVAVAGAILLYELITSRDRA